MAIGITNKDSSFYTVTPLDNSIEQRDFEKDLMSFTIREQTGMMPSGTLQFYDPNHIYSRIFRTGAKLAVSWGYKKRNAELDILQPEKINFDEITGSLIRRGMEVFVHSPSGSGDNSGRITYNCNFQGIEFRGEEQAKIYSTGTKKTVIQQAMTELGILPVNQIIDFDKGNELVTNNRQVFQYESTFRFISRMAVEWQALFHVSYNQAGLPVGIFIDQAKINTVNYPALSIGASGKNHMIGYKGEISNVISYKWTSNESESGIGDNVKIEFQNGQIVTRQYVAETETVVTWQLNQDKVRAAFTDSDSIDSKYRVLNDILSAGDFEEVKHFFDPISTDTAPQGFGYRINCEMVGNPLFTPPNEILINNGFPDRISVSETLKQNKFYINSVAHTINKSGYKMSVEIVDTFILTPTGLLVR